MRKDFQVSPEETDEIMRIFREVLDVLGDAVEFGCYQGDSSVIFQKILEESGSDKKLWLYDSFAGLPKKSGFDASSAGENFKEGGLPASKAELVRRFKKMNLRVPIIRKAFFEDLTETDVPETISFGFLDGDFYQSIKTSLQLSAPRVVKGGVLIVHDYNNPELPGPARAVEEFLKMRPDLKFSQRLTLGIIRF